VERFDTDITGENMEKTFGEDIPDEIKLPAQIGSIPALLEFVSEQAKEVGFDEGRAHNIVAAIEEALLNVINFACGEGGEGEIEIKCGTHGEDSFLIDIVDSCRPFNMLAATSFPETEDFAEAPGKHKLSTIKLKRMIRNIEYRRDPKNSRNILCCIVAK
jgi:anti-sigma regulatory factor (Ser/Thr protein kinase)